MVKIALVMAIKLVFIKDAPGTSWAYAVMSGKVTTRIRREQRQVPLLIRRKNHVVLQLDTRTGLRRPARRSQCPVAGSGSAGGTKQAKK